MEYKTFKRGSGQLAAEARVSPARIAVNKLRSKTNAARSGEFGRTSPAGQILHAVSALLAPLRAAEPHGRHTMSGGLRRGQHRASLASGRPLAAGPGGTQRCSPTPRHQGEKGRSEQLLPPSAAARRRGRVNGTTRPCSDSAPRPDEPPATEQSHRTCARRGPCLLLEVDDALHRAVPLHHAHGLQRRHVPAVTEELHPAQPQPPAPQDAASAPPAALI